MRLILTFVTAMIFLVSCDENSQNASASEDSQTEKVIEDTVPVDPDQAKADSIAKQLIESTQ